jgi:Fe-S oxidoreductase
MPELIAAARADIVSQGKAPPIIYDLEKNIQATHNLYGKSSEDKFRIFEGQKKQEAKPEILYFIGCLSSHEQREIPQAFIKILSIANIPYLIMEDECCGDLPYELGLRETANECAKCVFEKIKNTDVNELVVSCPHCYEAFTQKYPKWGMKMPIKISHVSDYLNKLLSKGKLNLSKEILKKVVYHDSSKLARFSKIFDAPRDLIAAIPGVDLREMGRNRIQAYCCGGGGLELTNPQMAIGAAKLLIEEAFREGAEILLTADPYCKRELGLASEALGSAIEVCDIVELVAKVIE